MSANFLRLPSELRNRIYELCLLHTEPIDPWAEYNELQELTLGLLCANKTVHRETSSLFYALNCFDFTMATPEGIALFLRTIGRNNANSIQHVYINFPTFYDLEPSNVALAEGSIGIFANIQSSCANLITLTTSLHSTDHIELRLDALDNPQIVTEALKLVDTHFRAISSLQEIIVKVYESGPSGYIRREMESHGWKISVIEDVEEWGRDRFWEDASDNDYGYGDDDYDIDNDSDFWRRAAD
jgi:hypothetical protein